MSLLRKLAPKKFLLRYPLRIGAVFVGILMCCVMVICIICTTVQVLLMNNCKDCDEFTFRNAYGFSFTGILYCIFMLLLNIWYLWGIKKTKASVVIGYFVVSAIWLAQTLALLIVLICLYSVDHNLMAWLLCLLSGLVAIATLGYCLLVVFGYWLELKEAPPPDN